MTAQVLHGDCLEQLCTLNDCSVDAVITDPPYELGFMGRRWDSSGIAYSVELWRECLRVLKPGGHLASFGGTRTYHRMACAIEDAGFEIRDSITWLYGSGFPKSLDISKAIDKAAGAERVKVPATGGLTSNANLNDDNWSKIGTANPMMDGPDPATDAARAWQGWGTALKPAAEQIVLARKPLAGTVAANVLAHGTGGLNIDATRVPAADKAKYPTCAQGGGILILHGFNNEHELRAAAARGDKCPDGRDAAATLARWEAQRAAPAVDPNPSGRWPTNVVLSHGEDCADECAPGCPVAELDAQSGILTTNPGTYRRKREDATIDRSAYVINPREGSVTSEGDSDGASRFFPVFRYQAKAPTRERPKVDGIAHPTVKPLALMRWLVRLLTPPGGVALDPFAGSGTTLEAATLEGFASIGIEREADYLPLIAARLERAS